VKPRAAHFSEKRFDFAKQSNALRLLVEKVQTLDSSQKNRLCEALNLYKLFVKPRAAYFPEKRIEAAP
jgi:hypothetical protein